MLKMRKYIFLVGNDGTGKSTLARMGNAQYPQFTFVERSGDVTVPAVKEIDAMTLLPPGSEAYESAALPRSVDGKAVAWVVLHAPTSLLRRRILARSEETGVPPNEWETEASLDHYGARFLAIAARFRLPVVKVFTGDDANRPLADILADIVTCACQEN